MGRGWKGRKGFCNSVVWVADGIIPKKATWRVVAMF